MNVKSTSRVGYQFMAVLAIISGAAGIALQFLPGGELLALMVSGAALGGFVGGSSSYAEQDRQRLAQSYKMAFETLLLIIMAAYAVLELSKSLSINGVLVFLNGHWPGLMIALMCALMGIAGLRKSNIKDVLKA